jgi:hypothetical protein
MVLIHFTKETTMPKPTTLLALLTLSTIGCSAKVNVATESSDSKTTTRVILDVLQTKPASSPRSERNSGQIVVGDNNTVIAAEHVHLHLHRSRSEDHLRNEESHDEECNRLRQEHLARVARWRVMIAEGQ